MNDRISSMLSVIEPAAPRTDHRAPYEDNRIDVNVRMLTISKVKLDNIAKSEKKTFDKAVMDLLSDGLKYRKMKK